MEVRSSSGAPAVTGRLAVGRRKISAYNRTARRARPGRQGSREIRRSEYGFRIRRIMQGRAGSRNTVTTPLCLGDRIIRRADAQRIENEPDFLLSVRSALCDEGHIEHAWHWSSRRTQAAWGCRPPRSDVRLSLFDKRGELILVRDAQGLQQGSYLRWNT